MENFNLLLLTYRIIKIVLNVFIDNVFSMKSKTSIYNKMFV